MRAGPTGNGSGEYEILLTDKGGWLVVYPAKLDTLPNNMPILLSRALEDWFGERPHLRIRSALPIVRDGNTVVIHAFYEQHLWPRAPVPTPPAQGQSS